MDARRRLERLERSLHEEEPRTYLDSPTGPELQALFEAIEEWEEDGSPSCDCEYDEEEIQEILEEVYGADARITDRTEDVKND